MTRVEISPAAAVDLLEIVASYLDESGVALAHKFEIAWHRAILHLKDFPASGSPRLSADVGIPNLRAWPVPGFPHLLVYAVATDMITVLRILHAARDIPSSLRG